MRGLRITMCAMLCVPTLAHTQAIRREVDATGTESLPVWRVATSQRIDVTVKNINPFLHRYRFLDGKTATYSESAIADFAKLVFGLAIPSHAPGDAPAKSNVHTLGMQLANTPGPGCQFLTDTAASAAATQFEGLVFRTYSAYWQWAGVKGKLEGFQRAVHDFMKSTDSARQVMGSGSAKSTDLRSAATKVSEKSDSFVATHGADTLQLGAVAAALAQELTSLSAASEANAMTYPTCTAFPQVRLLVAALTQDTAVYRVAAQEARVTGEGIRKLAEVAGLLERDRLALEMSRTFGPFDDPTRVTFEVQRTALGPDTLWRTVANPMIEFGGGKRRFAITVGGATAPIARKEYGVSHEYITGATAADSVASFVRMRKAENRIVSPLVGLTGRIYPFNNKFVDGVHAILGAAITTGEGKAVGDYFLGMALSTLDERIFLSAGAFSGFSRELAPEVKVDARLPAAQTTIPIREQRLTRLGFSVTLRAY